MFWVATYEDFISDFCEAFHEFWTDFTHMKGIQFPQIRFLKYRLWQSHAISFLKIIQQRLSHFIVSFISTILKRLFQILSCSTRIIMLINQGKGDISKDPEEFGGKIGYFVLAVVFLTLLNVLR